MASSALNVLSGIAAAAAGLAGEKVSKNGEVPGLDLAVIIPALLGNTGGTEEGVLGLLATAVKKSGLLNSSNLKNLAQLAGTLLSVSPISGEAKGAAGGGITGLAAAIAGNSGSGTALGSIASLAAGLMSTAKNDNTLTGMASQLGKTLSGSFGVSYNGSGAALRAMDKVLEKDTKSELFKAILKGLV